MTELKRCPICGCLPELETQTHYPTNKGIRDGGYPITIGRYKCPRCGLTPNWGKCYSTYCGNDKNATVWNKMC